MTPKITILMAVYNGEVYLRQCIDSVLSQTCKDFEFLIVDDGSTDSTRDIIRSYSDDRIRLIENERNLSQVTSLNIGLDHASGEYIARIDADDIMLPDRIEKQYDFLSKRPEVVLSGSWAEAMDSEGKHIGITKLPVRNEEIIATILFGEFILVHSSIMFRKKPVMDIGKYNEAFSFTEDYKLAIDLLLKRHKIVSIPDVLIKYRLHDDRISVRDAKPQIQRYIIALKQFIRHLVPDFSELDSELLFNFLFNAGSMNKSYWENGVTKCDISRIIMLSDLLLKNTSNYFSLNKNKNYFMKRLFFNKVLNFAYQNRDIKSKLAKLLYAECLKNCFFILNKPKLYLYPFATFFSHIKTKL
ncbi:MAG: glycosyltransferase [Candidatus Gorgyraea atricola]|nr:glycosyltransferase [Candidatus Gorgyraea atricola]